MSEDTNTPARAALRPRIIPAESNDHVEASAPAVPKRAGPPLREDPRALAALRAAELRNKRIDLPTTGDEFEVKHLEPEGWTYAWFTWAANEQRQSSNIMAVEARGWTYVPRSRHPELMPRDADGDWIFRKGMVMMEMPTEIVEEYKRAELKAARDQVRWKEQSIAGTPEGTLPRGEDPRTRPRINKSFEAMPIPDK